MICADDVPQTIPILKIADLETELTSTETLISDYKSKLEKSQA